MNIRTFFSRIYSKTNRFEQFLFLYKGVGLRILLMVALTAFSFTNAPKYSLENEKLLFSFKTDHGKIMTLCEDTLKKYIVYRFGTKDKIELEFPQKDKHSWNKFVYSFFVRGGGVSNDGIDLNYLAFTQDSIKYVLYDTYSSTGEKYQVGIKIIDLKKNSIRNTEGKSNTKQGTLIDFREHNLIKKSEELYD